MKDCDLGGSCLSKIIGFSRGLTAFTYRFGGRAGDGGTSIVYTPLLARILTPHRLMMRTLDFDNDSLLHESLENGVERWRGELRETRDKIDEEDEENDTDADSESLNSGDSKASAEELDEAMISEPYFPNLTSLRIGIKLTLRFTRLSGKTLAEWLPASLEELEFVGYQKPEGDSGDEVTKIVQRREELLPNLKMLNGVDQYIENGKELDNEEDYVGSDEEVEEDDSEEAEEGVPED